jgi:hypothetical protein
MMYLPSGFVSIMGVWQGVALGLPNVSLGLAMPYPPDSRFRGGCLQGEQPAVVFYPLDTPRRTAYASGL